MIVSLGSDEHLMQVRVNKRHITPTYWSILAQDTMDEIK